MYVFLLLNIYLHHRLVTRFEKYPAGAQIHVDSERKEKNSRH